MSTKQRDWRFECLRLVAMLFIVTTHFLANDNLAIHTDPLLGTTWLASLHDTTGMLGQIGVSWFVLISAYFLSARAKHMHIRIFKLWLQVEIFSVIALIFTAILKNTGQCRSLSDFHFAPRILLSAIFPVIFGEYWFISAFIVMMIFAPLMNLAIKVMNRRQFVSLIGTLIFITFLWKFLNPLMSYYTDWGYLCSLYLIGAFIRKYPLMLPRKNNLLLPVMVSILCFALCLVITYAVRNSTFLRLTLGYPTNIATAGNGASPILSVVVATVWFMYIEQYCRQVPPSKNNICNVILLLSPATLAIYLLHENPMLKLIFWPAIFGFASTHHLHFVVVLPLGILTVYCVSLALGLLINNILITPITSLVLQLNGKQ